MGISFISAFSFAHSYIIQRMFENMIWARHLLKSEIEIYKIYGFALKELFVPCGEIYTENLLYFRWSK